ncbi:hypothetical protein [Clostridium sp. B9]|uniref:hypothetical protein n=1 Tax=Clostridium sp. B9 TaxID=3423224 RepID=UPI003D2EEB21
MLIKDFIMSAVIIVCLLYLLYICYSKYIENKQEYFKILTMFFVVEVVRRSLIYGKVNGKIVSIVSIFQIFLLIISCLIYILNNLRNIQ